MEPEKLAHVRKHMREHAIQFTGAPSTGLEIAGMIRILANLYENHRLSCAKGPEVSGPRMGILFHLLADEKRGRLEGMTPSEFSRGQNVSRNTISALLRGLEQQGLIERSLDAQDMRVFRIRLSSAGRELVNRLGPQAVQSTAKLAAGLSTQEQEQLLELLTRLFVSLKENGGCEAPSSEPTPSGDLKE